MNEGQNQANWSPETGEVKDIDLQPVLDRVTEAWEEVRQLQFAAGPSNLGRRLVIAATDLERTRAWLVYTMMEPGGEE